MGANITPIDGRFVDISVMEINDELKNLGGVESRGRAFLMSYGSFGFVVHAPICLFIVIGKKTRSTIFNLYLLGDSI